jgi:hypothetical protein
LATHRRNHQHGILTVSLAAADRNAPDAEMTRAFATGDGTVVPHVDMDERNGCQKCA